MSVEKSPPASQTHRAGAHANARSGKTGAGAGSSGFMAVMDSVQESALTPGNASGSTSGAPSVCAPGVADLAAQLQPGATDAATLLALNSSAALAAGLNSTIPDASASSASTALSALSASTGPATAAAQGAAATVSLGTGSSATNGLQALADGSAAFSTDASVAGKGKDAGAARAQTAAGASVAKGAVTLQANDRAGSADNNKNVGLSNILGATDKDGAPAPKVASGAAGKATDQGAVALAADSGSDGNSASPTDARMLAALSQAQNPSSGQSSPSSQSSDSAQLATASAATSTSMIAQTAEKPAHAGSSARSAGHDDNASWLAGSITSGANPAGNNYSLSGPASDSNAFGADLQVAQQVKYWVSQGVQNAELKLDGLGKDPVHVSITMHGNEASIAFRSDESVTRGVLENAGTHLKDLLSREGLVLAGLSVGTSLSNGAGVGAGMGNGTSNGTGDGTGLGTGGSESRSRQGVRVGVVTTTTSVADSRIARVNVPAGRSLDLFV